MNQKLWALTLGNFAVGTGSLIVAGILPAIASGLGTSVAMAGQLVAIYGFTLAIGAPLLGIVTGRIERRPLMLGGLAVFVLACLIGALAANYTTLALSRALAGIGAALFTPNAAALAAQLVPPEQRGRAIALVFAGFSLASVVGVPLGTCVGGEFGWRSAFALVAALALLAIVLLAKTLPRAMPLPPVALRSWLRLFRQPAPMLTVTATVLNMAGQYALFTYIAALLARLHGIGPTGLGAMLVWFGVAGVLGNAAAGRTVDRVGAARVATFGIGVVLAAFMIMAYSGASLALTILAIGLWGGAAFAISSAQQVRLVNQNPRLASATLALNTSALYIGQAGGAVLGGITISLAGLQNLHWAGAMLLTAALAASIWESLLPFETRQRAAHGAEHRP
jgi:multidrug resistance protein